MKIIVLGGQGFIGFNLVKELSLLGHAVTVIDRKLDISRKIDNCTYVQCDFNNIKTISDMFYSSDAVYHLISTTTPSNSDKNIQYDINSNLLNTITLLEICVTQKVKKIIYASSGGTVYGTPNYIPIDENHQTNPLNSYGIIKLAIEKYIAMFYNNYGLKYTIFRISNPFGPFHNSNEQGIVNIFINRILNNDILEIWGDGSIKRDYIYIDDLIDALLLGLQEKSTTNIFNVSSGIGTSISHIIKLIKDETSTDFKIKYKDKRDTDVLENILDNSLIKKSLGWNPKISLKCGIEKTVKFKKNEELL